MTHLFAIGTCILMHGYYYTIDDIGKETYVLAQQVILFEEYRTYWDRFKISYIDKEAKEVHFKPNTVPICLK